MIFCDRFGWTAGWKSQDDAARNPPGDAWEDVLVGFIHVEEEDQADLARARKYLVKNLKWAARKNETRKILLHSFSHLSSSLAPAPIARQLLNDCEQRLDEAGYQAGQTPFGYFLNLDMQAPGLSTARIFTSF